MKKRILCGIIMALVCLCILSSGAYAVEEVASGGNVYGMSWKLTSDGILTIDGYVSSNVSYTAGSDRGIHTAIKYKKSS